MGESFLQHELKAAPLSAGPDESASSVWPGWGVFFAILVYAVVAMLLVRELAIPLRISSADGILPGDPRYYHEIALAQAQAIRVQGFVAFDLRPEGQGPAGIASLLYLVSSVPEVIVGLNALLHAIAGVALVSILMNWFSRRLALAAALPFVVSPYMIVWFSQINKDSFAAAGAMLLLAGFVGMTLRMLRGARPGGLVLLALCGVALLWIVRPYVNQILLPVIAVAVLVSTALALRRPQSARWVTLVPFLVHALVLLLTLSALDSGARSDQTLAKFSGFNARDYEDVVPEGAVARTCINSVDRDVWKPLDILPDSANEKLRALAAQRCMVFTILYADSNPFTQGSFVDADVLPASAAEAIAYIPRAFLLGLLAPWPSSWLTEVAEHRSVFYTIVPVEVSLLYAGLCALLAWLCLTRRWSVLLPVIIAVAVLTVYGMSTPFVGTLYRYRYPFWMCLLSLGLAAAFDSIARARQRRFAHPRPPVQ